MRSCALLLLVALTACAPRNVRPEWIRTAGSAYGCPPAALALADTSRGFWGRDPRTFAVGTGVCELIVRTSVPTRVVPDRERVGTVRETWYYDLPADAAGAHTAVVTLEGMTRREMVITALQDLTTPATSQPQEGGGRRRRG